MTQIVIDTNVLVTAMRSRFGASFRMLQTLGDGRWQPNISTALILEYEEVLVREAARLGIPSRVGSRLVDRICEIGRENQIFFRWRLGLRDPDDEFLLELAIGCNADCIVTYNLRDFRAAAQFGIRVLTPGNF